jgi:hypothetical protein
VARVRTVLSKHKPGAAIRLTAKTLAVINIRLTAGSGFFAKISVTTSVHANWHMRFKNALYPLRAILLEIGYNGVTIAEGAVISDAHSPITLLSWTESNNQQVMETVFLKGASNAISVHYKIIFDTSNELPAGFQNVFSETQTLHIGEQSQEAAVKVFLR